MILMYHKVDIVTPTLWWVTPGDLERQLDALKWRRFVYLDDYSSPDEQVVITFDDAYENVFRHALPILKARGLPFEVFVIGNVIGDWNDFDRKEPPTRFMSLDQLEAVAEAGGRLQWHTRSHPDLARLDIAAQVDELAVPDDLRTRFPDPHFSWVSYPGGSHVPRTISLARERFRGGVSVTEGEPGDRMQLNRVTVDRTTCLPDHPPRRALKLLRRLANNSVSSAS